MPVESQEASHKPQTTTQQHILATVCNKVYIHNRWIDLPLAILLVRNVEGKAADELDINDFFFFLPHSALEAQGIMQLFSSD